MSRETLQVQTLERIASFSKTGNVIFIISGLSIGFDGTLLPTVFIISEILVSYFIIDGAADPVIGIYGFLLYPLQ